MPLNLGCHDAHAVFNIDKFHARASNMVIESLFECGMPEALLSTRSLCQLDIAAYKPANDSGNKTHSARESKECKV
jgi:hypothetical protein